MTNLTASRVATFQSLQCSSLYTNIPQLQILNITWVLFAIDTYSYLRMCFKVFSLFRYLMFSRIADRAPSSSDKCFSSHSTTAWLLSHRYAWKSRQAPLIRTIRFVDHSHKLTLECLDMKHLGIVLQF